MNTLEAIYNRRSCRNFTDEPVTVEQIDTILKAAFSAPTAVNTQPWEYIVINDESVLDKVKEELEEVKNAIEENNPDHIEEEIGDLLFTVVNLARFLKVRPNVALFRCNEKVKSRFQRLFNLAKEKGIPLDKEHVVEMNELWDEIKKEEKND